MSYKYTPLEYALCYLTFNRTGKVPYSRASEDLEIDGITHFIVEDRTETLPTYTLHNVENTIPKPILSAHSLIDLAIEIEKNYKTSKLHILHYT